MRASYNLSGRRLEGELAFAYTTLTYRARLTQVCNDKMAMGMGELSFAYTTLTYRARLTQVCNGSEL